MVSVVVGAPLVVHSQGCNTAGLWGVHPGPNMYSPPASLLNISWNLPKWRIKAKNISLAVQTVSGIRERRRADRCGLMEQSDQRERKAKIFEAMTSVKAVPRVLRKFCVYGHRTGSSPGAVVGVIICGTTCRVASRSHPQPCAKPCQRVSASRLECWCPRDRPQVTRKSPGGVESPTWWKGPVPTTHPVQKHGPFLFLGHKIWAWIHRQKGSFQTQTWA